MSSYARPQPEMNRIDELAQERRETPDTECEWATPEAIRSLGETQIWVTLLGVIGLAGTAVHYMAIQRLDLPYQISALQVGLEAFFCLHAVLLLWYAFGIGRFRTSRDLASFRGFARAHGAYWLLVGAIVLVGFVLLAVMLVFLVILFVISWIASMA